MLVNSISTRFLFMKQVTSLSQTQLTMMFPGITIKFYNESPSRSSQQNESHTVSYVGSKCVDKNSITTEYVLSLYNPWSSDIPRRTNLDFQ